MPVSTSGDSVLIATIVGANLDVLGDQAFTMAPGLTADAKWYPEKVVLANASEDADGFAAILNTLANQGGVAISSFTLSTAAIVTAGRAVCVAGMDGPNTVNPNRIATIITTNTAFLHVTHVATAGAGTVDVYIYGRVLSGQ